ncbi:hypothetical protein ACFL3S_01690 [Gemmatimonadota bacterium]
MPGWAPFGLVILLFALGMAVWELFPPGVWHDDGVYVMLGRSLATGEGLRYVGVSGAPLAGKFPPLFPLLLAGVWAAYPAFPENAVYLTGLNIVLLSLAGGAFSLFLRRGLGLPGLLALGISFLAWLSADLWRVALVPLSEPLFLGTMILALWAGARMEGREGTGGILLFLLAGGAVFYARTLGIALLLAGVVALFVKNRRTAAVWTLVGTAALILPWALWCRAASATVPEPFQDTLGSYSGWWMRQALQEPGAFLAFLPSNLLLLLRQSLTLLLPGVEGPGRWVGIIMVPLVLLGLWEMGRRCLTLPLTLALSFVVLLLWPFQDIRLSVPFQPFLILGGILGFRSLLGRVQSRSWVWRGGLAIAVVWVALLTAVSGRRLLEGWPGGPYRARAAALEKAVRAVDEKTPSDAVVGAPELWSGIHLFTGRTVIPSARFFPMAQDGPSWGTEEEQYQAWVSGGLTHVLVEHGGGVHGAALDRVDERCAPGTVQVLDLQPGQFLVRLSWDEDCRERLLGGGRGDRSGPTS